MNIENEKQLIKLLDLLGLKKLELNDQIEIKEKLTEIIESVAQQNMPTDKINEYATIDFADTIIKMVEKRTDELLSESESTINLFSVVNACKGLKGDSAKLAALIIGLLAYYSNDSKYLAISKALVSNMGPTNENDELYLYKKVQGLTSKQQSYMLQVLEGCTIEEIDKKFDLLLNESIKGDEPTYHCICPNCGKKTDSKKACNLSKCDECNETLKSSTNEGKGMYELDKINEDSNPFKDDLRTYRNIWNTTN